MSPRLTDLFAACVLVALAALPPAAQAQHRAKSDILDLDDKDRALVAKEGVKQRREQKALARTDQKGASTDCGSVDIGNDDANTRKSGSRLAERSKTVIVTGNVINTASCR